MYRTFSVVSRAATTAAMSQLSATRIDKDASLEKAERIEGLIQEARAVGLSTDTVERMISEKNEYANLHMTTVERDHLRNVLFRQGLGYSGAYIGGNGINFTVGGKITDVFNPIEAFQTVLNSVKDIVEFNGKLVLFYYDTEEEVVLNVENSKIAVAA